MKRYIIAILITICGLTAMAQNRPDMTHQSTGRDRIEVKLYADQPQLVYDNTTNQIAVYGNESEYYYVTITSSSTLQVVFSSIISGDYDIIDASIMSSGTYYLSLMSSHGNSYQWTFNQGLQGGTGSFGIVDRLGDRMNWLNDFGLTPFDF